MMGRSGTLRQMRRRLRGTRRVLQVTQALERLSSVRLLRCRALLGTQVPYTRRLGLVLRTVYAADADGAPLLLQPQSTGRTLLLVFGAERGLCGGYGGALVEAAAGFARDRQPVVSMAIVGRQAHERLRREGWTIDRYVPQPLLQDAAPVLADIARFIAGGFRRGIYRDVHVLFGRTAPDGAIEPALRRLLPVNVAESTPELDAPRSEMGDMPPLSRISFEPRPADLMRRLVSDYVRALLAAWFLHGVTGEHAARRLNMARAGDNAQAIIDELTLAVRRERQQAITTEVTELSGGVAP